MRENNNPKKYRAVDNCQILARGQNKKKGNANTKDSNREKQERKGHERGRNKRRSKKEKERNANSDTFFLRSHRERLCVKVLQEQRRNLREFGFYDSKQEN